MIMTVDKTRAHLIHAVIISNPHFKNATCDRRLMELTNCCPPQRPPRVRMVNRHRTRRRLVCNYRGNDAIYAILSQRSSRLQKEEGERQILQRWEYSCSQNHLACMTHTTSPPLKSKCAWEASTQVVLRPWRHVTNRSNLSSQVFLRNPSPPKSARKKSLDSGQLVRDHVQASSPQKATFWRWENWCLQMILNAHLSNIHTGHHHISLVEWRLEAFSKIITSYLNSFCCQKSIRLNDPTESPRCWKSRSSRSWTSTFQHFAGGVFVIQCLQVYVFHIFFQRLVGDLINVGGWA